MALNVSSEWQEIADALIQKFPIALGHVEIDKVLFLNEDSKTPKKYADTRNVPYPFNFITDYKYIIIFYANNIQAMTPSQKHMLCFHELLHIDESFEKLRKHNIEDFRELISRWGINWDIDPNLPDILDDDVEE